MAQPAVVYSPLIFISYHADDQGFTNRLVSKLDRAAHRYGIWLDEVAGDARVQIAERTRTAVQQAAVSVWVISRRYLASTWAVSEEGSKLLRSLPTDSQPLRFLMVDVTTAEELSGFAAVSYRRLNDVVLVEETIERQDDVLEGVKSMVERLLRPFEAGATAAQDKKSQLTLADLSRFDRSAEVKEALRRAWHLAVATRPPTLTTMGLLFGLAEGGRVEVDYLRTPQFLWQELTARGEDVYQTALLAQFPELAPLDEGARRAIDSFPARVKRITPDVLQVFDLAEAIAHATAPERRQAAKVEQAATGGKARAEIGARHLLGALLLFGRTGSINSVLSTIVGDVAVFRDRFYNFIVKNLPDDYHELWRSVLTNLTLPEIPSPPKQSAAQRKESAMQPAVAGFMADDWTGDDLLNIKSDVNALASLVAACNVNPPLSIGLFGDWGSGKSHFMRQMRKRVELLSKHARDSLKPQKELGYYKRIVQIEFNAWHYIEGNLWASLVDHIFANLKLSEREDPTYAEQRRDELMQKLGVQEGIQKKINSRVKERENELSKLNERKKQAEAARDKVSTQLEGFKEEARSSLDELSIPVAFSAEEKELLGRLGINVGTELSAADVRKNYLKVKSGWNSLKARWQLFRTDPRATRRYLLSALLAAIPIAGALLVNLKGLPGLPTTVATALGFVATAYIAAKPTWDQFRKSLQALEKRDAEVERQRQQRITQLDSEVAVLTKEIVDAKLEGETIGREVEKLKADVTSTNTSKLLAEFIEDRAAATDYRRHLGLLALIRRDFEKLRGLFDQQREEARQGKADADETKIDRIVLYIDDLDRCPPDRVVQVLQAIHLLLAFPLFVVVVGVDSRWITRSLQQSYEWLQETADETTNGEKNNGVEERDDNHSSPAGATPHDYLEKIFQIPFWLKCMNSTACADFLDGLTKDVIDNGFPQVEQKDQKQADTPEPLESTTEAEVAVAKTSLQTSVPSVEKPVDSIGEDPIQSAASFVQVRKDSTQSEIDLAPRSLTFTSFEVDYMKQLVPLIGRSPRAVKRFLNCYRLIKVGLTPAEFDGFVGEKGEGQGYKATMVLLGIITGAPLVSPSVMEKLRENKDAGFEAFVGAVKGNPAVQLQVKDERLTSFFEKHDFGTTPDLLFEEMLNYASRVSRFSFGANWDDSWL